MTATTESVSSPPLIYERMAAVLRDLQPVAKAKENTEQRFKYRGIEDVLNALHDCLGSHQVFYLPRVLERIPELRMTAKEKNLWTVHLHVEYRFYTVDGSYVIADAWGEGTDMADKATSKAMTFAQKATLLQAFSIATEDMVDPDASGEDSSPMPERDWYEMNGWESRAAHDAYRNRWVDAGKAMNAEARDAFKMWLASEGIGSGAHTKTQAEKVEAYLGLSEDFGDGNGGILEENPPPSLSSETPSAAKPTRQSRSKKYEGEGFDEEDTTYEPPSAPDPDVILAGSEGCPHPWPWSKKGQMVECGGPIPCRLYKGGLPADEESARRLLVEKQAAASGTQPTLGG